VKEVCVTESIAHTKKCMKGQPNRKIGEEVQVKLHDKNLKVRVLR